MQSGTVGTVFVYRMSDGAALGSWRLDLRNRAPAGIAIDPTGASQSVWVVDGAWRRVYEYAAGRSLRQGSMTVTSYFRRRSRAGFRPGICVAARRRVHGPGRQRLLPGENRPRQPFGHVGMLSAQVVDLARIATHVVELAAAAIGIDEQFPVALPHGEHRAAVDGVARDAVALLPEERPPAVAGLAQDRGPHVHAVGLVSGGHRGAGEGTERRQEIDPGKDSPVNGTSATVFRLMSDS